MEILTGLIVLAGVALGILWSEVDKWRKKGKLTTEQLSLLYELARTAVSAAETALGSGTGQDKFRLAYDGLVELAARIGVKLSQKEATVLIHAVLPQVTQPPVDEF